MKNTIQKTVDGAVTTLRLDDARGGWEQWFLLMSDNHHDSVYCNRDLEIEHLEEAKRKQARIFIFGDFFDAMQGRFDPRRSMDELRPEYRVENYYDVVVRDSAKFLSPYADLIDVISDGNHELAVRKNANTDLIDRLVYELRQGGKSTVVHGGYGGWIRMMFDKTGVRESIKLKYFHGAGAEAPVTRGVIQTNRQAVYLPDADVVVNGHCFDDETEILTPYGWKKNSEIQLGTEVFTLNRENGFLEINKVNAVHRFDDYQSLFRINSRATDLLITDRHGLYVAKTDYGAKKYLRWNEAKWYSESASESFEKSRYMLNAGIEDNQPLEISDAKLRVIAWIMTEGSIESNSRTLKDGIPGVIRISQSDAPDGRLELLERDLNEAGIKYTKIIRNDDNKIHRNYDAYRYNILNVVNEWTWIGKYISPNKNPMPALFRMSLLQRKLFIETWIWADGSRTKSPKGKKWSAFQLSTNNKMHVDFLQNILFRSGYRSQYKLKTRDGVYWMACCDRRATTIAKTNWSKEHYSGRVWCVTVPNGTVVVRRNGKCTITMNSHNAYYVPIARERISDHGKLYMSLQHHVRIPGYKQDYGDGTTGWSVTKGSVPKPIGAVWMRLWMSFENQSRNHNGEVKMQFLPDVRGADAVPCIDNICSGKVYDEDSEGA